jgi:hypothetical protein
MVNDIWVVEHVSSVECYRNRAFNQTFIMNLDISIVRCNFPNFFGTTIGPLEDVK